METESPNEDAEEEDEDPSGMEEEGGLPPDGRETPAEGRLRERLAERKQQLQLSKELLETAQRAVIKLQVEKETKVKSHIVFNVTFSLCAS